MSTTTVNTFPPLHALDAPRGWFIALIVLMHVGFVLALNDGLSFTKITFKPGDMVTRIIPEERVVPPLPDQRILDPHIDDWRIVVKPIDEPVVQIEEEQQQQVTVPTIDNEWRRTAPDTRPRDAVIAAPAIPSGGLSEPLYPASDIRAGHEGTVVLSLEVLENGRVGQIRLVQSSGYASLDRSAMREARTWRFKPGTRDGIPVVLWKEVPIKFEVREKN